MLVLPLRHLGVAAILLACGCADAATIPRTAVLSVDVSIPNPATSPGDAARVSVAVFGETGRLTDRSVVVSSSNPSVATVSDSGVVTGIAVGSTYIKAVSDGVSDSLRFRVVNSFKQVETGNAFACGLAASGKTWCWGINGYGAVPISTRDTANPVAVPTGLSFVQIAAGDFHVCGITAVGAAYCWGYDPYGLGGPGSFPLPLGNTEPLVSITSTANTTCGLDANGLAYCWGNGLNGGPVHDTVAFASLSAGGAHVCGIGRNGLTYCWGDNTYGQLGVSSYTGGAALIQVPTPVPFFTIQAGNLHTCAIAVTNDAYCWGYNFNGELGNGGTGNGSVIKLVRGAISWRIIAAGRSQSCGITTTGEVFCWGYFGVALPNGSYNSAIPIRITTQYQFDQLSVSEQPNCAHTTGGGAYCWGAGYNGALGNGNYFSTLIPQRVVDP